MKFVLMNTEPGLTLAQSSSLTIVIIRDISENSLQGPIPDWNLTKLRTLCASLYNSSSFSPSPFTSPIFYSFGLLLSSFSSKSLLFLSIFHWLVFVKVDWSDSGHWLCPRMAGLQSYGRKVLNFLYLPIPNHSSYFSSMHPELMLLQIVTENYAHSSWSPLLTLPQVFLTVQM